MESLSQQNSVFSDSLRFDRNIEETERELCDFYGKVLKALYRLPDVKSNRVRQSLGKIRSYRNPEVEVHDEVDFGDIHDRCAYIFAYCIVNSIVLYDRFSDMLEHNPSMVKKIVAMKGLGLCILGGGPAFEIAAICKVLSKMLVMCGFKDRPPLQVHVTVIDICADWEIEANYIIKSVQKELCTHNNIEVDFKYLVANLTRNFSPDIIKAIQKSHFVTMFKLVSNIHEVYVKKKLFKNIHKIIESMSFRSCLFFLDTSGGGAFRVIDEHIDALPRTSRIYGPNLYHCYQLDADTVDKFSTGTTGVFRTLRCTSQTTVSTSVWIKVRHSTAKLEKSSLSVDVNERASILQETSEECKEEQRKIKIKKELQSPAKLRELTEIE